MILLRLVDQRVHYFKIYKYNLKRDMRFKFQHEYFITL